MAKERRRTASKVLQYLALMLLVMQVCLCLFVFFKVVVIPMSTRTTILQAW